MSDPADSPFDPRLTPLTREILAARDAVLGRLTALGNDRMAMLALTYAAASYIQYLAARSGNSEAACVVALSGEILQTIDEAVMTAPIAPPQS